MNESMYYKKKMDEKLEEILEFHEKMAKNPLVDPALLEAQQKVIDTLKKMAKEVEN
jgi:hypothetical protein